MQSIVSKLIPVWAGATVASTFGVTGLMSYKLGEAQRTGTKCTVPKWVVFGHEPYGGIQEGIDVLFSSVLPHAMFWSLAPITVPFWITYKVSYQVGKNGSGVDGADK